MAGEGRGSRERGAWAGALLGAARSRRREAGRSPAAPGARPDVRTPSLPVPPLPLRSPRPGFEVLFEEVGVRRACHVSAAAQSHVRAPSPAPLRRGARRPGPGGERRARGGTHGLPSLLARPPRRAVLGGLQGGLGSGWRSAGGRHLTRGRGGAGEGKVKGTEKPRGSASGLSGRERSG